MDVSRIPDATPTLHTGAYKANPYTVLGKTYFPMSDSKRYVASGTASWYGTKFHGQNTANGEVYDLYGMSAAHKTLPLPSYVKVTNLDNNRTVILRVNDRGPFYSDRIIDLSYAAAKKLGYAESGTARVKVEGIDPQEWWAQRGRPAPLMLNQPQVMAQATPPALSTSTGTVEQYTPPPQQHAAPVVPLQVDAKKKRFRTSRWAVSPGGSLRQPGRCGAPEVETERDGSSAGVRQLDSSQSANALSGPDGTDRHAG